MLFSKKNTNKQMFLPTENVLVLYKQLSLKHIADHTVGKTIDFQPIESSLGESLLSVSV